MPVRTTKLVRRPPPRRTRLLAAVILALILGSITLLIWVVPSKQRELDSFDKAVEAVQRSKRTDKQKHLEILRLFGNLSEKAQQDRDTVAAVSRAELKRLKQVEEWTRQESEFLDRFSADARAHVESLGPENYEQDGKWLERSYELGRTKIAAKYASSDQAKNALDSLQEKIRQVDERRRSHEVSSIDLHALYDRHEYAKARDALQNLIRRTALSAERAKAQAQLATIEARARQRLLDVTSEARRRPDRKSFFRAQTAGLGGILPDDEIKRREDSLD